MQKGKVVKILRSTYFCTVSFLQILSAANVLRNEFLNELSIFNLQSYVDDSQMIVFCKCRPFSQNVTNSRMIVCMNLEVHPSGTFNQIKKMELQMTILVRLASVFSCQSRKN